jgi:phosphatidylserine decarboxylase
MGVPHYTRAFFAGGDYTYIFMRFGLTKYGRREWVLASLLIAAGIAASIYVALPRWAWCLFSAVPLAAVWAWVIWFFRDPERELTGGPELLASPADGRVTDITPVGPDSPLGCEGVKVGIFMSVFDVHVNRSPADAVVEQVYRAPGVFLDARDPLSAERNESATTFLRIRAGGREHLLVIRQVAGLIARRIVTDLRPGQRIARGQRIGMIKFGSRMEVLAPRELYPRVLVTLGQHVQAGRTALIALEARSQA